ncbi:nuclear transport factor 2 [Zopfochytrium polystomum]|nr:nuclear transport factor 2 [Zopfochytrium polystomum]
MAAAAPINIHAVAKQFTEYYYGVFDSNRAGLLPLNILQYLVVRLEGGRLSKAVENLSASRNTGAPFQSIQHVITTTDVQPSHPTQGSILISVDDNQPMGFMQVFNLYPEGTGQYFVYNGA